MRPEPPPVRSWSVGCRLGAVSEVEAVAEREGLLFRPGAGPEGALPVRGDESQVVSGTVGVEPAGGAVARRGA
jgi:hypothetical protein